MLKAFANTTLNYKNTHPKPPVGAWGPGGLLWGPRGLWMCVLCYFLSCAMVLGAL